MAKPQNTRHQKFELPKATEIHELQEPQPTLLRKIYKTQPSRKEHQVQKRERLGKTNDRTDLKLGSRTSRDTKTYKHLNASKQKQKPQTPSNTKTRSNEKEILDPEPRSGLLREIWPRTKRHLVIESQNRFLAGTGNLQKKGLRPPSLEKETQTLDDKDP